MSKKCMICLSGIATALLIIYFAYQAKSYGYDTISVFFREYINNTQKYLFNGTLYGIPLIYGFSRPFMSPEYRIRMKKNITSKIISKSILDAFLIATEVMLLFLLASVLMHIKIDSVSLVITIYVRLVLLYAQCNALYYFLYVLLNSEIIAACTTMGVNFSVLLIILLYNVIANPLQEVLLNIFLLYISLSCLSSFVFLALAIRYRRKNI